MKALVLAGGLGSRLGPLTRSGAKQLLPVANKPIIHYVLENLRAAEITDVGVLVGSQTADGIKQNLQDGSGWGLNITYIYQEEPLGLAHCVLVAEEFLDGQPFVMYLGDNMLRGGIKPYVARFLEERPNALLLLTEVEDPAQFGVAEFTDDGRLKRLVEKPQSPPSNRAITGIYFFDHHVIEAAHSISPSWRNELEITDAIQWLLDNQLKVDYSLLPGWWKDTGNPDDLLEANVLVLQDLIGGIDSSAVIDSESQILGQVLMGPGVEIRRSVIRGPVVIGPHCKVEDAYIGASTALGAKSVVKNSEVSCSIIMEGASIEDVPVAIDWSLIGRDAVVCPGRAKPNALNLVLGDLSKVALN